MSQLQSSRKTETVLHHSTEFCGLGTVWQVSTGSDNKSENKNFDNSISSTYQQKDNI